MKKIFFLISFSFLLITQAISEIIHLKCEQQNKLYEPPPIFMAIDFDNKKVGFSDRGLVDEFNYEIYKMSDFKIFIEGEQISKRISGNSSNYGEVTGVVRYLERLIIDRSSGRVDSDLSQKWTIIEQTDDKMIFGRSSERELDNCDVIKPGVKF